MKFERDKKLISISLRQYFHNDNEPKLIVKDYLLDKLNNEYCGWILLRNISERNVFQNLKIPVGKIVDSCLYVTLYYVENREFGIKYNKEAAVIKSVDHPIVETGEANDFNDQLRLFNNDTIIKLKEIDENVGGKIKWYHKGKLESLKTFEQFKKEEVDPYNEEDWSIPPVIDIKKYVNRKGKKEKVIIKLHPDEWKEFKEAIKKDVEWMDDFRPAEYKGYYYLYLKLSAALDKIYLMNVNPQLTKVEKILNYEDIKKNKISMKKYYQFINENLNNDMKPIGSFEIESGKVMISDPCYERGTWCQGILNNVVKGKWNAYIKESDEKEWGTRAAELIAVKDGYKLENLTGWNESGIHVGVDSGQAGIYDDKYYNDNTIVKGPFKYKSSSPEDNITGGIDYALDKMGMDKETLGKIFQKGDNELKTKFKELRDEYEKTQKKRYRVVEYNWKTNNGEWYDANCVQTLNIKNPPGIYDKEEIEQQLGGCIPFGCVSSAGYGDGSYTCYFITLPGEGKTNLADPYGEENWEDNLPIIAIKIVFIDDNLENDLYDDYEGGNIPYADEDEYENDDENDG